MASDDTNQQECREWQPHDEADPIGAGATEHAAAQGIGEDHQRDERSSDIRDQYRAVTPHERSWEPLACHLTDRRSATGPLGVTHISIAGAGARAIGRCGGRSVAAPR